MKFYSLWLCLACVAMFALQSIIPGFTDALILNQSAFTEPWRFLTAIFLHGSLPHLLYNIFALAFFGMITEKFIGSRNFLIMFFSAGIIANLIGVNFYESSLGASGAIYGIIGCLTLIQPMMIVWAFSLPMPMFIASIIWTAGDFLGLFIPSNTGHIAHLSGVAVGLIVGIVFRIRRRKYRQAHNYRIRLPEKEIREWEDRWLK